ncbi:MAG: GAF domain-containing protein [Alphaproteobacteria bacterium]|nr:GAF domain-containing protein [Alphaproteobacteria bacterium]
MNMEVRLSSLKTNSSWIISFNGEPVWDNASQQTLAVIVMRDITEKRQSEELLTAQRQALEMVLSNAPLKEVLLYLAEVVEKNTNTSVFAVILLLDEENRLRHGAAPSLPDAYNEAIDGLTAHSELGTCGAAAATGKIVITESIDAAPSWQEIKQLPLDLGLKAAWTQPIFSRSGKVLGTFGTYFRECRSPDKYEMDVVAMLSRMAAIAIENKQDQAALRISEERFRNIAKATSDAIWDWDMSTNKVWWSDGMATTFGHPLDAVGEDATWWYDNIHPDARDKT